MSAIDLADGSIEERHLPTRKTRPKSGPFGELLDGDFHGDIQTFSSRGFIFYLFLILSIFFEHF